MRPMMMFSLSFLLLFVAALLFTLYLSYEGIQFNPDDLARDLLVLRCMGYLLILMCWRPLTRLFSKPNMDHNHMTPELMRRWGERAAWAAKGWWKVALLFVLFELVAIQKVGFS